MLELNKQALFFELDGVLIDSNQFRNRVRDMLMGHVDIDPESLPGRYTFSDEMFLHNLRLMSHTYETMDQLISAKRALEQFLYCKHSVLKTGVISYLQMCRDIGLNIFVVSSSPADIVNIALTRVGISSYFSGIITDYDVCAHKPDPSVYYRALSVANCSNCEALAFEGSYVGCLSATQAGIDTVLVGDSSYPISLTHMLGKYKSFMEVLNELEEEG